MVMLKLSLEKPFGQRMEIFQIIVHVRRSWQHNGDGNIVQTWMAVVVCPPRYPVLVRYSCFQISDQGPVSLGAGNDEVKKLEAAT